MIRGQPISTRSANLCPYTPLFASMAVAVPLGWAFPALKPDRTAASDTPARQNCLDPRGIAALNQLPATTILAPIDLGAPLIFWTPHRLVAPTPPLTHAPMAATTPTTPAHPAPPAALV